MNIAVNFLTAFALVSLMLLALVISTVVIGGWIKKHIDAVIDSIWKDS